jgi:hypothetical protein
MWTVEPIQPGSQKRSSDASHGRRGNAVTSATSASSCAGLNPMLGRATGSQCAIRLASTASACGKDDGAATYTRSLGGRPNGSVRSGLSISTANPFNTRASKE